MQASRPGRLGIRTSSRTTSGMVSTARSVAAMPSPASPTTSMSRLDAEQHGQAAPEELLVVDDDHPDRFLARELSGRDHVAIMAE